MARKKKSNKPLFIFLMLIIGVIVIVGIIGKQQGWIGKQAAQTVELAKAKPATIVEQVSASGKIQPVEEVKISPEVSGEIREIFIEEGDSVHANQLLLKIRPDNLKSILDQTVANLNTQKANLARTKAQLAQVKAEFVKTELDYTRNKDLFEQKVISAKDFETSKASYLVAKANLEAAEQGVKASEYTVISSEASVTEARENLALTSIYAPMAGIVTRLDVEKGERVVGTKQMAGTEMLSIANLDEMEVRVDVNENDIIRISMYDTAIIDVDSYSYTGEKFKGLVTAIANSANQTQGISAEAVTEFEVKIQLLKTSYKHLLDKKPQASPFRPGMTASVDIITERKSNILSVPLSAVTTRSRKDLLQKDSTQNKPNASHASATSKDDDIVEVVFVHNSKDGTVKLREVKTGISDFENIEILEGVEDGEEVVSGPYLQVSKLLKNGDLVKTEEKGKKQGQLAQKDN
ncbi:efflux RND transporter periplasmic adaptor subunit [Rapidithrix thailandica]|uniref:Efflux RND transporter periplasmic adaptor subunit n=1 Tax=Rapidithrix thailandica TaxID=413964 RepID=A0AAW9SCT7_9BACT